MIGFCKENKKTLLAAFFATIFTHLIKFLNYYPTWDSVFGVQKPLKGMTVYGRWFSGVLANLTSSPYDVQWAEGVVSAIFLAFALVLFLKIFDIREPLHQYICIALFVTFPCLASTFAYQYYAPAYACAFLFAVGAIYLCVKSKLNRILAIVLASLLLALSLGTYQSYYTFALLILIFYIFTVLLKGGRLRETGPAALNAGISFAGGAILYWGINKIVLAALKTELSDYQGISAVRLPGLKDLWAALRSAFNSFILFFRGDFSFLKKDFSVLSLYPVLNAVIAVLLTYCVIRCVILNKKIRTAYKIVMPLMILSVIPLGYAFYFISSGVIYHRVMEFGNYFVYFLPVLFLQHAAFNARRFRQVMLASLAAIVIYNFFNANIAYHQMSISYEKTYFQNIEIASRIDEAAEGEPVTVAVIGRFGAQPRKVRANPQITGADSGIFTVSGEHVVEFANNYLGRSYAECEEEKIAAIRESETFKEMPVFPAGNSVKLIDGVIVVKLSN